MVVVVVVSDSLTDGLFVVDCEERKKREKRRKTCGHQLEDKEEEKRRDKKPLSLVRNHYRIKLQMKKKSTGQTLLKLEREQKGERKKKEQIALTFEWISPGRYFQWFCRDLHGFPPLLHQTYSPLY